MKCTYQILWVKICQHDSWYSNSCLLIKVRRCCLHPCYKIKLLSNFWAIMLNLHYCDMYLGLSSDFLSVIFFCYFFVHCPPILTSMTNHGAFFSTNIETISLKLRISHGVWITVTCFGTSFDDLGVISRPQWRSENCIFLESFHPIELNETVSLLHSWTTLCTKCLSGFVHVLTV